MTHLSGISLTPARVSLRASPSLEYRLRASLVAAVYCHHSILFFGRSVGPSVRPSVRRLLLGRPAGRLSRASLLAWSPSLVSKKGIPNVALNTMPSQGMFPTNSNRKSYYTMMVTVLSHFRQRL